MKTKITKDGQDIVILQQPNDMVEPDIVRLTPDDLKNETLRKAIDQQSWISVDEQLPKYEVIFTIDLLAIA